jgi:serine/threonine protein kinase
MRRGPYDPFKVDVFSFGATVWEMVEHEPPFAFAECEQAIGDQWPPLDRASDNLQDFLRLCSMPAVHRSDLDELLSVGGSLILALVVHRQCRQTSFIRSAGLRTQAVSLLARCQKIEEELTYRQSFGLELDRNRMCAVRGFMSGGH